MSSDTTQDNNCAADEQAQLAQVRERIDAIDEQIGELISQRAVVHWKLRTLKSNLTAANRRLLSPGARSCRCCANHGAQSGPLNNEEFARLFREIMSACLALENPIKVAF